MKKRFSFLLRVFVLSLLAVLAVMPAFAINYGKTSVAIKLANNSGGVAISWEKQQNIDGYRIYRREGSAKAVEIADVKASSQRAYLDKTAVSGTVYRYFAVSYRNRKEVVRSETKTILYLDTPRLRSVENSYGGIALEWSEVKGAKEYKVYRINGVKSVCIARVDASRKCRYTDTDVTNGKKYTYAVAAVNGSFTSAYEYRSSEKYMAAPKMKSVVNGDGYIFVSWKPAFGAQKYRVYRKTGSAQWVLLKTVEKDVLSVKDTTVKNGEQYAYTVEAVKGTAVSGRDVNGLEREYVSVPQNIKLANTNDCMSVKWSSVGGATQYRVYRKAGSATSWKLLASTNTPSYKDTDIKDGVSYRYTVRAVGKKDGVSAYLSGESLVALKSLPLKLYSMPDRVLVKWSPASAATGYKVYRKLPDAKKWSYMGTVKGKTSSYYEDTGVTNGKAYIYTVRQVKGNTLGSYDAEGTAVTFKKAPTLTAMLSPKGVKLQWTKASQGTGYVIDRYITKSKAWSTVATINKNTTLTYEHGGADYGKDNRYRVRVKGANMITNSETIFAIDPNKPVVALTYDDGPHPTVTHDILDVLEKYDAKATFFVVGSRVNEYKDCITREAELGCEIGNHTYNHTILTSASKATIVSDIEKTNDAVEKLTGIRPVVVRPPGGSVNSTVRSTVDYPLINWSVDTLDWKNRNSSSVVSSVKSNVRDGSIVLMHDLYGSTAKATEIIVPWLIDEGYQLVTVTQLMQLKGIYTEPGKVYYSGY